MDAFAAHLENGRYAATTTKRYIAGIAHFARWMTQSCLPLQMLDEHGVDQFLSHHMARCDCPPPALLNLPDLRAALHHLLNVLRNEGIISERSSPTGHIADELHRYDEHMLKARGLSSGTRHGQLHVIEKLLLYKFANRPVVIGDAFMLFLDFAQTHCAKSPTAMAMADITPELILAFLDHLEQERHNTVRSRNARLAALRVFLKFASHRDVASMQVIERALGVPMKRFERPMLGFLSREEMLAVIGTADNSWISQRDHLLLSLLYNTGARVSEIIGVQLSDVVLDGAAFVHLHGKGRKQRSVPLWRSTAKEIRAWMKLNPQFCASSALLPNRDGEAMTRDNVTKRLALAVRAATKMNAGLANHTISPHTIRHYVPFRTMSCELG
jgi:site-specific recombinase XerD